MRRGWCGSCCKFACTISPHLLRFPFSLTHTLSLVPYSLDWGGVCVVRTATISVVRGGVAALGGGGSTEILKRLVLLGGFQVEAPSGSCLPFFAVRSRKKREGTGGRPAAGAWAGGVCERVESESKSEFVCEWVQIRNVAVGPSLFAPMDQRRRAGLQVLG